MRRYPLWWGYQLCMRAAELRSSSTPPENAHVSFVIYSLQKRYQPSTLSSELYFRHGVSHWTQVIHHYSFLPAAHYWIDSTSQRPMLVDSTATFFNVKENAEPATVFQLGHTVPVVSHELPPGIAQSFETFNVCISKQHFSFFTAYSTM